jgi:hypothetical protein
MSRTKKPVVDRNPSTRPPRATEPRRWPVPRPPRRNKVFLLMSIVLLAAWIAILAWMAYNAWGARG